MSCLTLSNLFVGNIAGLSSENIGAELKIDMTTSPSESGSSIKISTFVVFQLIKNSN